MTERISLRLWNPTQAYGALTDKLYPQAKNLLMAGHRLIVELRTETRSEEQNWLKSLTLDEIRQRKLTNAECIELRQAIEDICNENNNGV